jgi:hypothetical protein
MTLRRTDESAVMENDERWLEIVAYDGEYAGDMSSLTKICSLSGGAMDCDQRPRSLFEEALTLLEVCAKKWATPRPLGDSFTIFIGRKTTEDSEAEKLVRLDVNAHEGDATAVFVSGSRAWNAVPVQYHPEDDVVTITHNVLRANVGSQRR